jgi:hypothetical protein
MPSGINELFARLARVYMRLAITSLGPTGFTADQLELYTLRLMTSPGPRARCAEALTSIVQDIYYQR